MRQQADGTYLFTDRPILFTLGAAIFAFNFILGVWHRYQTVHSVDGQVIGFALGVGLSVFGALSIPYTHFTFDPARKLITWDTRSFLRGDGGQVAFDAVESVVVQSMEGSRGTIYRVALLVGDKPIPLGVEYVNEQNRAEKLASTIRGLLGKA